MSQELKDSLKEIKDSLKEIRRELLEIKERLNINSKPTSEQLMLMGIKSWPYNSED